MIISNYFQTKLNNFPIIKRDTRMVSKIIQAAIMVANLLKDHQRKKVAWHQVLLPIMDQEVQLEKEKINFRSFIDIIITTRKIGYQSLHFHLILTILFTRVCKLKVKILVCNSFIKNSLKYTIKSLKCLRKKFLHQIKSKETINYFKNIQKIQMKNR